MTRLSRARVILTLGAVAAAGVVGAHRIAYWTAAPDPHERAELLLNSGHRYFNFVSAIAFGLAVVMMLTWLASATRRAGEGRGLSSLSIGLRLALMQTLGWVLLEGSERLLAGHDHSSMLKEPVLWIGILLQLLMAAAGALLLRGAVLVVEKLLRARRPRGTRRQTERWLRKLIAHARSASVLGAPTLRGPPFLVLTS